MKSAFLLLAVVALVEYNTVAAEVQDIYDNIVPETDLIVEGLGDTTSQTATAGPVWEQQKKTQCGSTHAENAAAAAAGVHMHTPGRTENSHLKFGKTGDHKQCSKKTLSECKAICLANGQCRGIEFGSNSNSDATRSSCCLMYSGTSGGRWSGSCWKFKVDGVVPPHGESFSPADIAKKVTYLGCFKDGDRRDLKHGPYAYGNTPESCRDACPTYKYFALQHNGWCSCGTHTFGDEYYKNVPDAQCDVNGKGKGGPHRNSMYVRAEDAPEAKRELAASKEGISEAAEKQAQREAEKAAAAAAERAAAAAAAKKVTYLGCFKDGDRRDLKHGPYAYGNTPESCRDACPTYKYFALQHNGWCSCGTHTFGDEYYKNVPDAQCDVNGKGKGGPHRNSMYVRAEDAAEAQRELAGSKEIISEKATKAAEKATKAAEKSSKEQKSKEMDRKIKEKYEKKKEASRTVAEKKIKAGRSKYLVDNAKYLKVFALINADKLTEVGKSMGVLGRLLLEMAKTKKKIAPVEQYIAAFSALLKESKKGLPRYTLRHIQTAMSHANGGLISFNKLPGTEDGKTRAYIDGRDLGIKGNYKLLKSLAVPFKEYFKEMTAAEISVNSANGPRGSREKSRKNPITAKEFKAIFMGKCDGADECTNLEQLDCYQKDDICKWTGPWKGD